MYHRLASLYKEYKDRAQALYDEFKQKAKEITGKDNVCNLFMMHRGIQLEVDNPTEGAKPDFVADNGTEYFEITVDGVTFTEYKCNYDNIEEG